MELRPLRRAEIELIWTIDRSELIERIYELRDGALRLRDALFDVPGWPTGTAEQHTPALYACFDRGGDFTAAFDGKRLLKDTEILDLHKPGKLIIRPVHLFLHLFRNQRMIN